MNPAFFFLCCEHSAPAVMPDNPFCFEGHQLPELFLLGVQKCGTTSLTKQLFDEWGFFGDAQAKGLSDDEAARRKARKAKASKAKKGKGRKGAESLSMLRMEDDPVAGIPL